MAEFSASGLDSFMLSLQQIAELPPEVQDEMLNAGADVLVLAQREILLGRISLHCFQ